MNNDYFVKYNFNPFQFAANKRASKTFHKNMTKYFDGCNNVLDLGCGKGEFLQALKMAGKNGFGIDTFDDAIQECVFKGLNAQKWDVRDFIQKGQCNVSNFDGVYCAHLIEHLIPEQVFELFKLLFQSSTPGTRFVFVTPNFEDISVSGSGFWLDLTHVRPYPGILVQRMLECVGFNQVYYKAIYGLGLSKPLLKNYLLQKIRFGDRIYKPNLIITACR
jgi:O-antigen chain-terminating methyltransferase